MKNSSPVMEADDVDAIWRRYFRAEMPKPWPSAPRPEAVQQSVPSGQGWQSRLALAASIAVILLGCWLFASPGQAPSTNPAEDPAGLRDATASPSADIHSPEGTVVPMDVDPIDIGSLE